MKLGWRFIKQLIKRNPLNAIDVARYATDCTFALVPMPVSPLIISGCRYTPFMATQLGYGFAGLSHCAVSVTVLFLAVLFLTVSHTVTASLTC